MGKWFAEEGTSASDWRPTQEYIGWTHACEPTGDSM